MNKRIKIIFISFVLVALAFVVASTFFSIQNLEVEFVYSYEDEVTLDKEGIISASMLSGKNVFTISEKIASENIEATYAEAKVIKIERIFPSSVKIYVMQREGIFAVKHAEGYAVIDREGVVVKNVADSGDIPVVYGDVIESAAPSKVLVSASGSTPKILEIVSAFEGMGYVGKNLASTVEFLDLSHQNASELKLKSGVKFVFNNSSDVYYQIVSFLNWYGTNPDYRNGGIAKIDNVFNEETMRFGIIYQPAN